MAVKENADRLDLADFQLPPKKKPRFEQPATEEEMATLSKGFVQANIKKNTTRAYKVFLDCRAERNKNTEEEECTEDLFDKTENPGLLPPIVCNELCFIILLNNFA